MSFFFLQFVYDYQIIDFYRSELQAYNTNEDVDKAPVETILAMGDSFTAGEGSWPGYLKNYFPDYRIINSGVGATGVQDALAMAKRRFSRFQPDIFIYQIYVGNDLVFKYKRDWSNLSFTRNVWWSITNNFPVLQHIRRKILNYRPPTKTSPQPVIETQAQQKATETNVPMLHEVDTRGINTDEVFGPDKYTERIKLMFTFDPYWIDEQVTLRGYYGSLYPQYIEDLKKLLDYCDDQSCRTIIMVIPDKSQVNDSYFNQYTTLGQQVREKLLFQYYNYPFYKQLLADLSDYNVMIVNFLPLLREQEKIKQLYFTNDEHLNPAGYQFVAKVLARKIELL